jgi:hypothetical protein
LRFSFTRLFIASRANHSACLLFPNPSDLEAAQTRQFALLLPISFWKDGCGKEKPFVAACETAAIMAKLARIA